MSLLHHARGMDLVLLCHSTVMRMAPQHVCRLSEIVRILQPQSSTLNPRPSNHARRLNEIVQMLLDTGFPKQGLVDLVRREAKMSGLVVALSPGESPTPTPLPQPLTPNAQPQTLNPKTSTLNPKP